MRRPLAPSAHGDHAWLRRVPHQSEIDAADLIRPHSGTQRARVLEAIIQSGPDGATDYEVSEATGIMPPRVASRRKELWNHEEHGGWIEDSGRTRPTPSGVEAIVWVVSTRVREVAGPPVLPPSRGGPRPNAKQVLSEREGKKADRKAAQRRGGRASSGVQKQSNPELEARRAKSRAAHQGRGSQWRVER